MLICLGLECFIASCTLPRRIMPLSCSQLMKFGRYINLLELSYMKRKVTLKRDSVCFTSFGLCWNSGLGCCICSSFHIFSIDILLELLILLVVIRGTYSRVYVFVCFVCVCFQVRTYSLVCPLIQTSIYIPTSAYRYFYI